MKVGGKPRTVCVQARSELQVFPFDEWRHIHRNNVENHWNAVLERVFWNAKRTGFRFGNFGDSANRKLVPITGI